MATYVSIRDNGDTEAVEVPTETDGSLLLSTVAAQFPGSVGLRFKGGTGLWRACRMLENKLDPPLEGWDGIEFYVVKQGVKRSPDDNTAEAPPNSKQQLTNSEPPPLPQQQQQQHHQQQQHQHQQYQQQQHQQQQQQPVPSSTFGSVNHQSAQYNYNNQNQQNTPTYTTNLTIPELMIANLPYDKGEMEIRAYFERFGELEKFNLAYDYYIKPKGYGFIKFKTAEATKVCIDTEHYIGNRRLDVSVTKRSVEMLKEQQAKGPVNNTGGVPSATFNFPRVPMAKVNENNSNLINLTDNNKQVVPLNNNNNSNNNIDKPVVPPPNDITAVVEEEPPEIHIGGLPMNAVEADVKKYCEGFGETYSFSMKYDKYDKKFKGFGFVKFKSLDVSKKFLNGTHHIGDKRVHAKLARSEIERSKPSDLQLTLYGGSGGESDNVPTKLFIGRLPYDVTDDNLREIFKRYSVKNVQTDITGKKGYGFVIFTSIAEAYRVMNDLHTWQGKCLNVSVADKRPPPAGANPDYNPYSANNHLSDEAAWMLEEMDRISKMTPEARLHARREHHEKLRGETPKPKYDYGYGNRKDIGNTNHKANNSAWGTNNQQSNNGAWANQAPPNNGGWRNQMSPNNAPFRNQMPPNNAPSFGNQMPPNNAPFGNQMPPNNAPFGNQMPPNNAPFGNQRPPNKPNFGNQKPSNPPPWGNSMTASMPVTGNNNNPPPWGLPPAPWSK